jgi:hypothetical protein
MGAGIVQRLRRRAAMFSVWGGLIFTLYLCFISVVDGPELVAGALAAVAVGLLATAAFEVPGPSRGLLIQGRRWYVPAVVWPLDVATDCVLLVRLAAARVRRGPLPPGEIRTLRIRGEVPVAVAGFWLSSTPGACVIAAEGRTLTLHALSAEPSRVERVLTAPSAKAG